MSKVRACKTRDLIPAVVKCFFTNCLCYLFKAGWNKSLNPMSLKDTRITYHALYAIRDVARTLVVTDKMNDAAEYALSRIKRASPSPWTLCDFCAPTILQTLGESDDGLSA